MKKTFLIIFSLIILLALGVFSTQAFTYEAYSGSSTGGTTGASFFDWSSYVNNSDDDDEDTWHFNGKECVEGQPAYFITSQTYKSKAECEEDNESSSQTYTGGGGLGVSWNDDYTMEWTNPTQYGAYENSYTQTQQPTIGGLEGFQISGFNDDGGLGYSASPDALTVDKNVTPGFSFDGANEFTMFGTGIAHDSVITGITPLSVSGLNTSSTGYTTPSGFTGMLKGLISGIATDLGFKPTVYTLPTENNIWKFTDVGDGDNILIAPNEKTDFIFTTEEGLTDNATVTNDGTIKFVWDATKNFKDGKCRLLSPQHSSFSATPTDKPLGLTGGEEIKFHITNSNDTADTTVTMKCYTKEQVDAGLKTSTNGVQKSIKVKITKEGTGGQGSDDKDFIFQTSNKKIEETIKLEKDTAKINLELAVNQAIYSSCSTEKVNDTNWEKSTTIIETKSKEVTFDKEGKYTFTVSCVKKADKISDEKSVVITVSKEDVPPTDDLTDTNKWSQAERNSILNYCNIEFVDPGLTSSNGTIDANTTEINAIVKLRCGKTRAKKEIVNGEVQMTPGFDARISKYGIEIHTANPLDFKNTITTCGIDKNFETNEPVKEDVGNGYNITCSSNLPRDAEAFSEIKKAIENNNTIKVFGFIEYKTNEITGTNFSGTEHVVLKRITTDKLGVGTGSAKSPEGDTSLKVTLSADKTQAKCEDVITLTATVENNGKNANCILTSTNDNSKTPDDAWNSKPVINGKFEKKTTLMGSNDKDVIYTYGIQCFKDAADKIGVKATDVQITVPKCTAKGEETSWGKICDSTKEKCSKGQIQWFNQVNLNFENNEYKVKNSSALNFGVDFKCDTSPFQAGFARLTIEDKIVQDVRLEKGLQSRVYAIPNVWEKLSETTRNNIINTFKNCNGCDSVKIAKEDIWVARWNTFDEKNTLKNPKIDCNYAGTHPSSDLIFIGHNLPKKQAPGGGSGEGGEGEEKPPEEKPNGKNSLPPGSTGIYFKNVKCGENNTYGEVFIVDKPLNYLLEQIGGFYLSALEWATPVPGSIITAYFAYNIHNIKVDKFTSGEFQKVSEPGKYTAFLQCDKGYITDNRSWFQVEPKWAKDLSVFMYEFTVKSNNIKEIKVDVKKGSFESYTSDLSFYCENCKDLCSHITIKKAGGPAITGWSVFKDNMPIVKGKNVITVPVSPRSDIKTNYQIVLKSCSGVTGVETKESVWKTNTFMSNVFANFQIRRNESIDYGILKIISDVTKRGDRY